MKKIGILWLIISTVIMLMFPCLADPLVKDDGEMAFVLYTIIYLILGIRAMLISMSVYKKT